MKADWVVLMGIADPFVECERCGAFFELELPMGLPDVAKLMLAFVLEHQRCKVPAKKAAR